MIVQSDDRSSESESNSPLKEWAHALQLQLKSLTHLCISDVSDGHTKQGITDGRALHADGLEILLLVVSDRFQGLGAIERQRLVNSVLQSDLSTGRLHSIQMRCLRPT